MMKNLPLNVKYNMPNKWIQFLAEFRKKNPSLSMKAAMKKGAIQWKSQKGKSADSKIVKKKSKKTKAKKKK